MNEIARVRAVARRRRRLAVDIRGAANIVASLVKYLSVALLLPAAVAIGYRESPFPFLAAGAIAFASAWGVERLTRGESRIGAREGS